VQDVRSRPRKLVDWPPSNLCDLARRNRGVAVGYGAQEGNGREPAVEVVRADPMIDPNDHARLLGGFTHHRVLVRLARLDCASWQTPASPIVVLLHQEDVTVRAEDHCRRAATWSFRHPQETTAA
jgi:hypothetical protein